MSEDATRAGAKAGAHRWADPPQPEVGFRPFRSLHWVPVIYAVFGVAWILGSDHLLHLVSGTLPWTEAQLQTVKGILFVVVTALALALLLEIFARYLSASASHALEARKSLSDFAAAATDWLWEMDGELRITAISGRFSEITGDPPDAMIGMSRAELVQLAGAGFEDIGAMDAQAPFRELLYPYDNTRGERFWFRVSGQPVLGPDGEFRGYRGIGSDVTERVRLRASRDRLAAIIEETPDVVCTSAPDGRIQFLNRSGREMLGLAADAAVRGVTLSDVVLGPDRALFLDEILPEAIRRGRWSGQVRCANMAGVVRTVSLVAFPHRARDGAVEFVSIVARDVTRELEVQDQLQSAQRMEALGQLTGGIAHDFNNLLMIVAGNAELLVDRLEDNPKARIQAEEILATADRGANLTHRLLAFSRRQSLMPERVDPVALTGSMDRLLHQALGEQITLAMHSAPDVSSVWVDPSELETCLVNLAVNARDAMPGGGRMEIDIRNVTLPPRDAEAGQDMPEGPCVAISVSDTGSGIAPEHLEQVFEPFFTTKGPAGGSGLGLSMVYGFSRQSGGTVTVESTPGQGTTFRIYLPVAGEPAAETPPNGARAAETPGASGVIEGGSERVLVVEDEPEVRANLVRQLERLGYDVTEAPDGDTALALLAEPGRFDLLLTDLVMPGRIGGDALARAAMTRDPGLRTLITTGYAGKGPSSGNGDRAAAATRVLRKPYRRAELARAIREVLAAPLS